MLNLNVLSENRMFAVGRAKMGEYKDQDDLGSKGCWAHIQKVGKLLSVSI